LIVKKEYFSGSSSSKELPDFFHRKEWVFFSQFPDFPLFSLTFCL